MKQAPIPADPWTDVFVADTLGDQCLQDQEGILLLTHLFWNKYSEDCLHMNIFTPQVCIMIIIYHHSRGQRGGAQFLNSQKAWSGLLPTRNPLYLRLWVSVFPQLEPLFFVFVLIHSSLIPS